MASSLSFTKTNLLPMTNLISPDQGNIFFAVNKSIIFNSVVQCFKTIRSTSN